MKVAPGSRHMVDLLAKSYELALRDHAKGDLLDLGCGEVPLYGMYRDQIAQTICVDWPKSYHGHRHVDVACDLNRPLPFADASFDTVVLTDVLEHLFDWRTAWAEVARVLRPTGRAIVGVPFMYWLHEDPYDFFRPTEFALRRCCLEHGLTVVSLKPYGGAADVLFDITAKHLAFASPLAWFQYWAGRATLPLARKLFARTERKFPLGYVLIAEAPGAARE